MKNLNILGLFLLIILFTSCESKWTDFNVNKKTPQHFTFVDNDGFVDTSFVFKTINRSSLDISEKATIKSVSLKSASVKLKGLAGNVSQKLKIEGYIKANALFDPYPFFVFSQEVYLDPIAINLLADNYLLADGTDQINKFLSDKLRFQNASECKLYLKVTPTNGVGKPINLDFDLNLEFNIQYTDCFFTGNFGNDDCK